MRSIKEILSRLWPKKYKPQGVYRLISTEDGWWDLEQHVQTPFENYWQNRDTCLTMFPWAPRRWARKIIKQRETRQIKIVDL